MGRNYTPKERPLDGLPLATEEKLRVGTIVSVDPSSATCCVALDDKPGQRRDLKLPLSYVSPGAWVRTIPELGTRVVIGYRGTSVAEILGYHDVFSRGNYQKYHALSVEGSQTSAEMPSAPGTTAASGGALQVNQPPVGLYRDLVPGEHDSMTLGQAGHWETVRGRSLSHGGSVTDELIRDNVEHASDAALFKMMLPEAETGKTFAQLRYGTVKRYLDQEELVITKDNTPMTEGGVDLKEFSLSVGWVPGVEESGRKLFDLRCGHVVSDDGTVEVASGTDLPLRFRMNVYNDANTEATAVSVDDSGNVILEVPQSATHGVLLHLKGGHCEIRAEKGNIVLESTDTVAQIAKNITLSAVEQLLLQCAKGVTLSSPQLSFAAEELSNIATFLNLGGAAAVTVSSGAETSVGSDVDVNVTAGANLSMSAGGRATLSAPSVAVESPSVTIGEAASALTLVLSTFLTKYNAHTHVVTSSPGTTSTPLPTSTDTTTNTSAS